MSREIKQMATDFSCVVTRFVPTHNHRPRIYWKHSADADYIVVRIEIISSTYWNITFYEPNHMNKYNI